MLVTQEQLERAEQLLDQMANKAAALRMCALRARDGIVEGITLTTSQKQDLKDRYIAGKAELQNLYSQLP